MAAMTPKQIKLLVFRELCRHDCDFMSCWIPLPTTAIAQVRNISLYQCRKQMRQLVSEGLAVRSSCPAKREDDCPLPYNGFLITAKGRDTDIYRYCSLQNARICKECFGADSLVPFLPENFNYKWIGQEAPPPKEVFCL